MLWTAQRWKYFKVNKSQRVSFDASLTSGTPTAITSRRGRHKNYGTPDALALSCAAEKLPKRIENKNSLLHTQKPTIDSTPHVHHPPEKHHAAHTLYGSPRRPESGHDFQRTICPQKTNGYRHRISSIDIVIVQMAADCPFSWSARGRCKPDIFQIEAARSPFSAIYAPWSLPACAHRLHPDLHSLLSDEGALVAQAVPPETRGDEEALARKRPSLRD